VAISGPDESAPGVPLGYPQTLRVRQYEYTALWVSALLGHHPLAPSAVLACDHRALTAIDAPGFSEQEFVLRALEADPPNNAYSVRGDTLEFSVAARAEGWSEWRTLDDRDNPIPSGCYALNFDVRATGPWRGLQIKAVDAAAGERLERQGNRARFCSSNGSRQDLTYLRELPAGLGPDFQSFEIPLWGLSCAWGPEPEDNRQGPFLPNRVAFVVHGPADAQGATAASLRSLHLVHFATSRPEPATGTRSSTVFSRRSPTAGEAALW